MDEMQLSLLGIGLGAIVLVLIYNRWQERKHRQQTGRAPENTPDTDAHSDTHGPVASAGDRQEPMWDHEAPDESGRAVAGSAESATHAGNAPVMPEPVPALTDAESWVDAVATLRFYEPRSAGSIRETLNQMGLERFERVEFYTADAWHYADALPPDTLVSNLRCRLQLASRRGPVSPEVIHGWIRSLESLAQMLSAGLSVESEAKLVERAVNLDAFCVRVDTLISLNLKPRAEPPVALARLSSDADALGLRGVYPSFARLAVDGSVDFQVQADASAGIVSLILDFPHVNRPDLVVVEMFDLARTLSLNLDADLIDDAGRPMSEEAMALLVNQVVRLSAVLQAQGFEPGSGLARRLFS
jgi:hypothetical protein